MILGALSGATAVASICLFVGVLLVFAGIVVGLVTSFKTPASANAKLDEAKKNVDAAKSELEKASRGGLEAGGAAVSAATATDAAQSALQQVQGIVASLPENLRFAGMLVLIGAVLMSVATIQFGGVSLF